MKNLLQAILQVKRATTGVEKNGNNTFHKYKYATANDVIHEVRSAMNEAGLISWPKEVKDIVYHKDNSIEEATVIFVIAHAESGEQMEVAIRAAGEDKGDKKAYKLNTGGLKYLLIQTFLLATDEDPENDSLSGNKQQGNQGQQQQGQQRQQNQQQGQQQGQQQQAKQQVPPPASNQQQGNQQKAATGGQANRAWLNKNTPQWSEAVKYLVNGGNITSIENKYKLNKDDKEILMSEAMEATPA